MTWQAIAPSSLQPDRSGLVRRWYHEEGLEGGDLYLWEDGAGCVLRFQLCFRGHSGGAEYVAGWSLGYGLRVGEVESGERRGERSGHKVSPTIRYYSRPDQQVLGRLLAYFLEHAEMLEPHQRSVVETALRQGLGAASGEVE